MEEIRLKYYNNLIQELCEKKLEENNTIDIDAYCLGLKDFAEALLKNKILTSN